MSHSSEKRWAEVAMEVSAAVKGLLDTLLDGEETFQRLVEVYTYAGGTDEAFAALLFTQEVSERDPAEPTAAEIQMVADARAALTAVHELYLAATNVTVTAADRAQLMRRMI